jgi:drug/metabolite transporter (DMT)-like permease
MPKSHWGAVWQALFVTFLWSTSWVFIKFGLTDIPALTFAALRYSLAFLCLLPLMLQPVHLASLRHLSKWGWLRLVVLGLLFYTVTQGAQFLGLAYLPAITVNLLLSCTIIVVTLLGIGLLGERPTLWQGAGVVLYLGGVVVYFYPASFPSNQIVGLIVVITGVLANALSAILGRYVNRSREVTPLAVTGVSMGIGAAMLLGISLAGEGMPNLSLSSWAIIGWLAVVNTALAFTLWNRTLQVLSAMESGIINNTMLIQIPLLALLFLGEQITWRAGLGMLLAGIGTIIVQWRR